VGHYILLLEICCNFCHISFFCFNARQRNVSRVLAMVWAFVCSSVRPFVTLLYCIKTVQARITKFYWGLPQGLYFFATKFCAAGEKVSLKRRLLIGVPPLKRYFVAIGFLVWKRLHMVQP